MKSHLLKIHSFPLSLTISMLLAMVGCGSTPNRHSPDASRESVESQKWTPDFYQEWNRVGKMNFASMTVTKTIATERTAWYKVGKRIAVYSFDIYLKAYMDMDKLQPSDISVDEGSGIIRVKLPEIEIEVVGRSSDLRDDYEDIGLFRSRPDARERAALKEQAFDDFQKEFSSNPRYRQLLLRTASEKARKWFDSLGAASGYEVEYVDATPVNNHLE